MFEIARGALFAAVLASSVSLSAHALEPQHFNDLPAMVEDFSDFSDENGTFKLVTSKPLHVEFSAQVVPGELPETVRSAVQRAALYGVYRTFVHTSAESVQVTALPMELDIKNGTSKKLKVPSVDVTVTRAQALAAVKKLIQVNNFAELVKPEQMGEMQLDNWTSNFKALYYEQPGIERLLAELKAKQR